MRLILIGAFISTLTAYAGFNGQVDAAVDNIPIAFNSGDDGSNVIASCNSSQHVAIHNETAERISWAVGTTEHGYVVANTTMVKDGMNISNGKAILIRSDSGAPITTGTVSAECW